MSRNKRPHSAVTRERYYVGLVHREKKLYVFTTWDLAQPVFAGNGRVDQRSFDDREAAWCYATETLGVDEDAAKAAFEAAVSPSAIAPVPKEPRCTAAAPRPAARVVSVPNEWYIATDGGCVANGCSHAKSSWAVVVRGRPDLTRSGVVPDPKTHTNNRAELYAVIQALILAAMLPGDRPVVIASDSQLALDAVSGSSEPASNLDLVDAARALQRCVGARFLKVKGHAGHRENEEADRLCKSHLE